MRRWARASTSAGLSYAEAAGKHARQKGIGDQRGEIGSMIGMGGNEQSSLATFLATCSGHPCRAIPKAAPFATCVRAQDDTCQDSVQPPPTHPATKVRKKC